MTLRVYRAIVIDHSLSFSHYGAAEQQITLRILGDVVPVTPMQTLWVADQLPYVVEEGNVPEFDMWAVGKACGEWFENLGTRGDRFSLLEIE